MTWSTRLLYKSAPEADVCLTGPFLSVHIARMDRFMRVFNGAYTSKFPFILNIHMQCKEMQYLQILFPRSGTATWTTSDASIPTSDIFLKAGPSGRIQALRTQKEKERNPDRICLNRYTVLWTICNIHAVYR